MPSPRQGPADPRTCPPRTLPGINPFLNHRDPAHKASHISSNTIVRTPQELATQSFIDAKHGASQKVVQPTITLTQVAEKKRNAGPENERWMNA